jgi:hypothetical protein
MSETKPLISQNLFDVLNNRYERDLLKTFCSKVFALENLEFWEETEIFKLMKEGKEKKKQKDKIIATFFSKKSKKVLSITDLTIKKTIETKTEENNIFESALQEVIPNLKNVFNNFIECDEWREHMSKFEYYLEFEKENIKIKQKITEMEKENHELKRKIESFEKVNIENEKLLSKVDTLTNENIKLQESLDKGEFKQLNENKESLNKINDNNDEKNQIKERINIKAKSIVIIKNITK